MQYILALTRALLVPGVTCRQYAGHVIRSQLTETLSELSLDNPNVGERNVDQAPRHLLITTFQQLCISVVPYCCCSAVSLSLVDVCPQPLRQAHRFAFHFNENSSCCVIIVYTSHGCELLHALPFATISTVACNGHTRHTV